MSIHIDFHFEESVWRPFFGHKIALSRSARQGEDFSLQDFLAMVHNWYPVLEGVELSFYWRDEEDERVFIESDVELNNALLAQTIEGLSRAHLYVSLKDSKEPDGKAAGRKRCLASEPTKKKSKKRKEKTKEKASPPSDPEQPKPLSSLTVEEVVSVLQALELPEACCAVVRERKMRGRHLFNVEAMENLIEFGFTDDVLSRLQARILLNNVFVMQTNGVPARFLNREDTPQVSANSDKKDAEDSTDKNLQAIRRLCTEGQRLFTHPVDLAADAGDAEGVQALLTCTSDMVHNESDVVKAFASTSPEARANGGDAEFHDTPLLYAINKRHTDVVSLLLEHKANTEARDIDEMRPLHIASRDGYTEIAALLIEHKANVNEPNQRDQTPLHLAAENGHVQVASLLIEHEADVNTQDDGQYYPLHHAVSNGHTEVASLLIAHGAIIETTEEVRLAPLDLAASNGHTEMTSLLLEAGVDIETIQESEFGAMYSACINDHTEIASRLLMNKANVNVFYELMHRTPLLSAIEITHPDTVRLLIAHGANLEAKNESNQTSLHVTVQNGQTEMVSILLSHRADIEAVDEDSYTPLHRAAKGGNKEITSLLIDHKANLAASTQEQVTPLHFAATFESSESLSLLLAHKANIEAKDMEDYTPLHAAAECGLADSASLLLEHKASIDAKTKDGCTSLHVAAAHSHKKIVSLLISNGANVKAKNFDRETPFDLASEKEVKALLRDDTKS